MKNLMRIAATQVGLLLLTWLLCAPISLIAQGPLIYGYVSRFPSQSTATSSNQVAWLNKYHVNYVQFYDWQWKHHIPLAGSVASPASAWSDLANRTNYRQTVNDYIAGCQSYGMKAMAYNLLYGAYVNYATDGSGVSAQWGLYNNASGGSGTQWTASLPATWAGGSGALAMFNPSNSLWQSYIFARQNEMFAAYAFDGWHLDQLGDPGLKYDYNGVAVDVWKTFVDFLNKAKAATGKRIVFNNVGTYGLFSSINQTANDTVYVECWPATGQSTYNDLKAVIDNGLAWGNGKPVVIAAYVNYSKASGSFNAPGVLLCDAAIFASGATHLELGDGGHMLCNEYFPNQTLSLSASLGDRLTHYYNFIVNYRDWLYGGMANSANVISTPGIAPGNAATNKATAQHIWAFPKVKASQHMINLINLVGESSVNWRDDAGTYPAPTTQSNFIVKYYLGAGTVTSVQVASPDFNGGAASSLPFVTGSDGGGNYVSFTVPMLAYWDMVIIRTGSSGGIPPAPTGVIATATSAQVRLDWIAVPGATSYNVQRASLSGGPYATNGSPTSATYTDITASNGTRYFYVVSAVNASGQSPNSSEVSAKPEAALPSPWLTTDIGAVGATGTASYDGGTFTVTGSGSDIESTSDMCRYVYRTSTTANCEIRARVASEQSTDPWAKVGVMIRDGTGASARNAGLFMTPSNGVAFQRRTTAGGSTAITILPGVAAPGWLRLLRSGASVSAHYSTNGVTWTQVGPSVALTLTSTNMGLAVCAHNNEAYGINTSTFDNVSYSSIPAIVAGSLQLSAGTATMDAVGAPGAVYRLEHSTNLSMDGWQDVSGSDRTASGTGALTLQDPNATGPACYYRIRHVSGP